MTHSSEEILGFEVLDVIFCGMKTSTICQKNPGSRSASGSALIKNARYGSELKPMWIRNTDLYTGNTAGRRMVPT
jgi:hypothetical protein